MSSITIYYYTAWNGYSWQGCDDATAASLQRYMEAAGVLPGDPGKEPPFGGAIACQVKDRMGVAVYRCGVRVKGDAFGRDSFFIALAFVPLADGPVDFAAIMALPQMLPSGKGELAPVSVPLQDIALPKVAALRDRSWRDESFTMRFSGIAGLQEASLLFFARSCQLGLMQATFASSTGSVAGVSVSLSYRVFPEVAALAEASKAYADAKKLSRGILSESHPASVKLWDAANQLQTCRIDKMPGYVGLAEYLAARDVELGGVIAKAPAHVRNMCARQESAKAATAARPSSKPSPSGRGRKPLLMYMVAMALATIAIVFAALLVHEKKVVDRKESEIRDLRQEKEAAERERDRNAKKISDLEVEVGGLEKAAQEQKGKWEARASADAARRTAEEESRAAAEAKRKDEDSRRDAELDEIRGRLNAATNNICIIRRKRVDDVVESIGNLLNAAERANVKQFATEELKRAKSECSAAKDYYQKNLRAFVAGDEQLDACIDKFKSVEQLCLQAFERAFERAGANLSDLTATTNRLAVAMSSLKSKAESKSAIANQANAPSSERIPRQGHDNALEDDAISHVTSLFGSCSCWRCREAEKLRDAADKEAKKLRDAAEKLRSPLRGCRFAYNESRDHKADLYARADFEAAMTACKNAYSDDVGQYIGNIEKATQLFKNAKLNAVTKSQSSGDALSQGRATNVNAKAQLPQPNARDVEKRPKAVTESSSRMGKCPRCNTSLGERDKMMNFCPYCGGTLSAQQQKSATHVKTQK